MSRLLVLVLGLVLISCGSVGDSPAPALEAIPPTPLIIVPLRSFPPDLLDAASTALAAELPVEITVREPIELPKAAYYAPRKRYRAELLLDFLDTIAAESGDPGVRVLGLTEVDISTTNEPHEDWMSRTSRTALPAQRVFCRSCRTTHMALRTALKPP